MRISRRKRLAYVPSLLFVSISVLAQSSSPTVKGPDSAEVATVKGDAGSCSADFVVSDSSGKPVYDAKIRIQIRFRFMGLHKLDASVGTNIDGKARIEGLPDQIKGTAEFKVSRGDQSKSVPFDPVDDCHAHHEVVLGEK
jgi:hypothetical protein